MKQNSKLVRIKIAKILDREFFESSDQAFWFFESGYSKLVGLEFVVA